MTYLARETFLVRIQRRERDYVLPDGASLRLRELMADERISAHEIGDLDRETAPATFRNLIGMYAYIVQRGVIDPTTGELLFTVDDIADLATARADINGANWVRVVGDAIWGLSEADPDSFRGGDPAPERPRHNDPDVRPTDRGGAPGAVGERGRAGDLGAHGDPEPGDGAGDAGGSAAGSPHEQPVDAL